MSRKHNLYLTPVCILANLFVHKVAELLGKLCHELRAWHYWRLVSVYALTPQSGEVEGGERRREREGDWRREGIPGVMQLLSNAFSSGSFSPFRSAFSRTSRASLAVRKRRLRCWFIFARGATPSTAIKNSFFGLIFPKR